MSLFNTSGKGAFSFGTTSTTKATGAAAPFSFGGPSGFSLGSNQLTTTSAGTSGLKFGSSTTSAAQSTSSFGSGFKFGSTPASSSATGLNKGFSLTGSAGLLTASTTTSVLSSSQATSSAPAFKGLGGTSSVANSSNQNGNGNKVNGVSQALKDEQVPEELCKDVQQFADFVKKQKDESGEVAKFSVRSLHKIREEMSTLSHALGSVSSALHRNKAAVQRLREDFTLELQHVEMSQRTQDIPHSLQHDNVAPVKFFMNMVMEFEASMLTYRRQIDQLENHLNSYEHTSTLTPQDIYLALCKMQESFITLAANLHSIHDQVKYLKEQYLVYRRIVHGETVDIFTENRQKSNMGKPVKTAGISPFNQLSNVAALAMASMVNQNTQQQQPQGPPQQGFLSTQSFGGGPSLFGTSKPTGTASLFGNTGTGGSQFGAFKSTAKPSLSAGFASTTTNSSSFLGKSSFNSSAGLTFGGPATGTFELKQPPAGNKRGKK